MSFFNKYPYTDFHELNLDWVISKVKELIAEWALTRNEWLRTREEFEELKQFVNNYFDNLDVQEEINNKLDQMYQDGTLDNIIGRLFRYEKITPSEWLGTNYGYYVSVNGDDSNSGDEEHPFRTLNHALNVSGYHYNDSRIYIISAGTYDIDYTTMSMNLHLTSQANDVIINVNNTLRNYASHSTIQAQTGCDMTINLNGNQWYFDGHTLFSNVKINGLIQESAGDVRFNNCFIAGVMVYNGKCYIDHTTLIDSSITQSAFTLYNSEIFFDSWDNGLSANTSRNLFTAYGSRIVCTTFGQNSNFKFEKAIIHSSEFIYTLQAYNFIDSIVRNLDYVTNDTIDYSARKSLSKNTQNVDNLEYKLWVDEINKTYDVKLISDFNYDLTGRTQYTYYNFNDGQVIYMSSTGSNVFPIETNEQVYLLGYGTLVYTDTSNVLKTINVPVVTANRGNNFNVIGIIFNRNNYNSLISVSINATGKLTKLTE